MVKRLFDFIISLVALILLWPFFLVIAVVIKADSIGPILYQQKRVGKNGIIFELLKFRTMRVGADKLAAITIGDKDSRITKVGFILRKYKIDELPQLINVLIGDMSVVGPRPELKTFVDLYNEHQRQVIWVRPGLTDLASIEFRNENALLEGKSDPIEYYIKEIMPVKLNLNLQYIQRQSLIFDIKIIFMTFFALFKK